MTHSFVKVFAISLLFFASQIMATERPPADALPLSGIIKSLEDKGYSPITDASIDDGLWDVEAYKDGKERDLKVDPVSGEIVSDKPDD